jgi:Asp-tRNA(Asn)/Glu-tRNA(Gln) amidotransferase A subunit family amidase
MNPFATATGLLADLRAGRVTSSELTETYIGRVEKHDERRNAVVEREFDRAREQGADGRSGRRRALRGLPITLQESFNVSGFAHDMRRAGVGGLRLGERRAGVGTLLAPACERRCGKP